jgi:hypothetical protein
MRKTFVIIGFTVLAAFGIACGGTGSTNSSTDGKDNGGQPVTATMGQTVTLTSTVVTDKTTVDVTVADPKQFPSEPGDFGSKSKNGVFLVVNVTVVCKEGTYGANPFNFRFVAGDGTVTETAFATFDPELHATDLAAGQKVAGNVVFDVPQAAITGGKIQISGIGLDMNKPAAYWSL